MESKNYPAICHVCGREFTIRAEFYSSSRSVIGSNGDERFVTTCNVENRNAHTRDEVYGSYDIGGYAFQAGEAPPCGRSNPKFVFGQMRCNQPGGHPGRHAYEGLDKTWAWKRG